MQGLCEDHATAKKSTPPTTLGLHPDHGGKPLRTPLFSTLLVRLVLPVTSTTSQDAVLTLIASHRSRHPTSWVFLLALVAVAFHFTTPPAQATENRAAESDQQQLWVGISDARGRPVEGLSADDFRILEGDTVLPVRRVEPLADGVTPWRQVLYFDQLLSDRSTLRRAADALADHAETLTALGTVEVVAADPEPRLLLPATRDSALLAQVLARLALEAGGRDEIGRGRRELLHSSNHPAALLTQARKSEIDLLQRQTDRLTTWLADHGEGDSARPRALWLCAGALALPRDEFFAALGAPGPAAYSRGVGGGSTGTAGRAAEAPVDGLARFLATSGWIALPLTIGGPEEEEQAHSEFDRWRTQAGAVERADAVDLLSILRKRRQQRRAGKNPEGANDDEARADRAALRHLALTPSTELLRQFSRQSGGQPVVSGEEIPALVARLAGRIRLVLGPAAAASPPQPPRLGSVRAIEVGLASDEDRRVIQAPAWIATGTADELGAARVRRLLDSGLSQGRLDLLAQVNLPKATGPTERRATVVAQLRTQLDLTNLPRDPAPPWARTDLRLTLSAETRDGGKVVRQIWVSGQDLSTGEIWEHSAALELPVDIERAALVIETLDGRLHGGDMVSLSFGAPSFTNTESTPEESPAPVLVATTTTTTDTIRRDADGRFLDTVQVRLTELYISVTGKSGAPIRGLTREEFILRQAGVEQPINSVVDAIDLPVTLGLAIDSSSSMFYKLPAVARAAKRLVRGLTPRRDRAFLVAFGPQPRLVEATTDDLDRIDRRLRDLEAEGGTPLWSAIILSLQQLEPQKGKKALVVFLDGADDDGNARYRECLGAAQRSGVPIYLIVMNNEAARTEGKDFRTRSFTSRLDRLAATGAGRVYYVPIDADLEPVYKRIENELRSYYLLTYYSNEARADPTAGIDIEVARKGSSVRTLSGYGPGQSER